MPTNNSQRSSGYRIVKGGADENIMTNQSCKKIIKIFISSFLDDSKLTLANLKILHDHDYYAYEPLDVPEHLVVTRNQHFDGEADPIEYPPFANPDQDGSVEEIPVQRSSSDRSSSGVF